MKAALIAYSKKLGKSFLNKNIFVKTLIPGAFETKDNSFGRLKVLNYKALQVGNFPHSLIYDRVPRLSYAFKSILWFMQSFCMPFFSFVNRCGLYFFRTDIQAFFESLLEL